MAGCFRPEIDMYDRRNGALVGHISGPCCCIGGQLCSSDWNFQNNNGERHAEIISDGEWYVKRLLASMMPSVLDLIGMNLILDHLRYSLMLCTRSHHVFFLSCFTWTGKKV